MSCLYVCTVLYIIKSKSQCLSIRTWTIFVYLYCLYVSVHVTLTDLHKSFSCLSRCRHATISKFFGDETPNCAAACDYCKNPKLVRAQLERAAALSTKTGPAQSSVPRGPFGFDRELYGGGRKGYGFERSADTLLKIHTSWSFGTLSAFLSEITK